MTAGWVMYHVSGALEMPPTVNLRCERPLATEAAMPSLPVALRTLTTKEACRGGTISGLQAGLEAPG